MESNGNYFIKNLPRLDAAIAPIYFTASICFSYTNKLYLNRLAYI